MATNKITYVIQVNDAGKVKIDGLTTRFVQMDNAVKKLNQDLVAQKDILKENAREGLDPNIDKTGLAGAALIELSRTISDSNYGFRAMANNISQLTTLLATLVTTTGGLGNAWKALTKAFRGPLGFIVVANIVIAIFEKLAMKQDEVKEKTDDFTSSLNSMRVEFEMLGKAAEETTKDGFNTLDAGLAVIKRTSRELGVSLEDVNNKFIEFRDLRLDLADDKSADAALKLLDAEVSLKETLKTRLEAQRDIVDDEEQEKKIVSAILKLEDDLFNFSIKRKRVLQDIIKERQVERLMVEEDERLRLTPEDFEKQEAYSQKLATQILDKGLNDRKNKFKEYFEGIELLRKKDTKNTEISEEAKMRAVSNTGRAFEAVGNLLQDLSEENKELMIAGIIVEKVGAIAQIIANTAIANAKAVAAFPYSAGQPFVGINTASAAVSIAATTAAAVKAVGAVRSGQDADIGGSAAGSAAGSSPQFNIVGQQLGQVGQLAAAISGQTGEPIRAYVVLDDVNSAAELDNKITTSGSIG